ncbi:MAG: T9SS type A sorting domain-containing protein [bacterium]|nr:T9SS type A sorting domain-containing protein [bacterium]
MKIQGFRITAALISLTVVTISGHAAAVKLNGYGHIVTAAEPKILNDNSTPVASQDGVTINHQFGWAQFDFPGECLPATAHLFDKSGREFFTKSYRTIINLRTAENGNFAGFFNGQSLVVLDLVNGQEVLHPASTLFAVDNNGDAIYFDSETKSVVYQGMVIPIQQEVRQFQFWKNQALIFTSTDVYMLKNNKLTQIWRLENRFFEARVYGQKLYIVEKVILFNSLHYELFESTDLINWVSVDQMEYFQQTGLDTHESIHAPLHYYSTSFPSVVKNGYSQIQEWSNLYLHPGVDMFESPGTDVYAVQRGIVKAILTTGDDQYWRIAISKFSNPSEGYLYAHLNHDSFLYAVGDTVPVGSVIGALYPATSFSPHCHFVRISPVISGFWNGNWWTVDNPLSDISNMTDTIPPVIENTLGNQTFAFRTPAGTYLDPQNLSGPVKIIAKCCDYAAGIGFQYRIPIRDIGFKLYRAANPDSAVYERFSFTLDMPLDTYFENTNVTLVLKTLYSRDQACFSTNNNTNRDFYYIITNSDGDRVIEPTDSLQILDLDRFPPGAYLLEVIVRDASRNRVARSMAINIASVSADQTPDIDPEEKATYSFGSNFPNPFNATTKIPFELLKAGWVSFDVFDVRGNKLEPGSTFTPWSNYISTPGSQEIYFDGSSLPSGVYLYRLKTDQQSATGKMILLK